jgi:centrosomal protein CEP41
MESAVGYKGRGLSAFDKKPLAEIYGNKALINKKIPVNPKYAVVRSVVDHGVMTHKDVETLSDSLIAKKKGENFGRIKSATLSKFLAQSNNEETIFGLMKPQSEDKENYDSHSVASLLTHKSEAVKSVVTTQAGDLAGVSNETNFILLDLREAEEYAKWHIKEAINFPAPNISRDKTLAQLLRFKNKSNKLIVVYMEDERQGTQQAKILFEKGFDNIYLLTGGLEKFLEAAYDMVEGCDVPTKPKVTPAVGVGARPSSSSQMSILMRASSASCKKMMGPSKSTASFFKR